MRYRVYVTHIYIYMKWYVVTSIGLRTLASQYFNIFKGSIISIFYDFVMHPRL
jgi:hypothetical protein